MLATALVACDSAPSDQTDRFAVAEITVPAAMESMGPNLAQGPDGTPVLSWIDRGQDVDSLRFATWSSGGWSEARTVVSGENWFVNWADFPSVVPVSASLWGAHWLAKRPAGGYAYDAYGAVSINAGETWSTGFTLHRDGTDTEHGFVTLYRQDAGIGAIWLDGRKMVNDVEPDPTSSGMTLRAATVLANSSLENERIIDDLVCDCCQTDVAITSDGPVAVYRNRSVDEYRDIYVSRLENGNWQPGVAVNDDRWNINGCPVNGPVIVAKDDDVVVVWFTTINEIPQVRMARSSNAGKNFSPPVDVITGETLGRVSAALLGNGDVAVGWLSSAADESHRLLVRQVTMDGTLGPINTVREHIAAFSFPQMLAIDNQLLLAWTEKNEERSRIGSALVSLGQTIN